MMDAFGIQQSIKDAQYGDHNQLTLLIAQFEPRIRKCLQQTAPQEREDLRQTLNEKLIEVALNYDTEGAPTFTEFHACLLEKKP